MSEAELPQRAALDHKGREFTIESIDERRWKITDELGRNYGTIVMVSVEGEGGDPVYGGVRPGEDETGLEGSDWASIAVGIINEAEAQTE